MALTSVVSDSVRHTSTETLVIFTVILLFYLYGVKYITDVSTIIIVRSLLFLLGEGRGGGGALRGILGGGVPPSPPNPDPVFQTKKCNFPHPFSDLTPVVQILDSQWISNGENNSTIHWIEIYLLDSAMPPLNY